MGLLFFNAFGLGMACAAPPGAVAAESLRRGLVKGFRTALRVQLGSLVGDALWTVIALSGNGFTSHNTTLHIVLSVIGFIFLVKISFDMFRAAWRGTLPQSSENTHTGAFRSGMFLSIANPYAIAFWIGASGAMAALGVNGNGPFSQVIFFGGFMLAAVFCCFAMAVIIAHGRKYLTTKYYRAVNIACGLFIAYLCINILGEVI